jgi:hypothetical protein
VKSLPHKDVFTAINGQMIASLADNQRTDEARTSNAFLNWLFGQWRHRDATVSAGASMPCKGLQSALLSRVTPIPDRRITHYSEIQKKKTFNLPNVSI